MSLTASLAAKVSSETGSVDVSDTESLESVVSPQPVKATIPNKAMARNERIFFIIFSPLINR